MISWVMFLTGLIFGWLLAWILQKRLDDSLVGQVSELQRDLNEANRQIRVLSPQSDELATPAEMTTSIEATQSTELQTAEAVSQSPEVAPDTSELSDSVVEVASSDTDSSAISAARLETVEVAEPAVDPVDADASVMADTAIGEDTPAAVAAAAVAVASATADASAIAEGDDLTRIRGGVGPKFAETLQAAGVTTLAALAESTPEQLQEIVQPAGWQRVDFEDWIEQAGVLAAERPRIRIGDDLTRLEGIGPVYAERLRAAGIINYAQLAETDEERLTEIINAPNWQRLSYADWVAQARLAAAGDEAGLTELQDKLFSHQGDNLVLISGIGKTSADALQGAGITTYAALAGATADQLAEVMSQAGVRRGNFEAWIEEANLRSAGRRISHGGRTRRAPTGANVMPCPQDLGEVRGIGEVYEQRLYSVGVGTFWELGMIPQEELTGILEIQDFQEVDLAGIQEEAMRLAASTESMGRVWDGTEPDDFEVLEGIGEVYERRLYAAGICSYSTLADLSVEQVAEVCRAPRGLEPNYARWLEQAAELMVQD